MSAEEASWDKLLEPDLTTGPEPGTGSPPEAAPVVVTADHPVDGTGTETAGTETTETVVTETEANPAEATEDAAAPDPWLVIESPTEAPVIGKVLSAPAGIGAPSVPFRLSGVSLDSLFMDGFHVAAGSMAGGSHLAGGAPRQDAYDFALTSTGRLVVAIADGMGSKDNSQVGARLFCEGVTRLASASPDGTASEYLIKAAAGAALLAQAGYQLAPAEISFAGAVAVLGPDGYEIARVGDVSAFVIDPAEPFTELFADDGGLMNVTKGLPTSVEVEPELALGSGPHTLVLTTDGLANDLRTSEAVRTWLLERWSGLTDSYGMAEALRYRRRGSHDDRTAVVISFKPTD